MAQVRWLVAVDTGGAPTDVVAFGPDGALRAATGLDLSATDLIFHGTTVATNAMLNDRLAQVVLLITEGFRDVLSYRNGTRAKVYDLEKPRPSQFCAPSRPVGGARTTLQPGRRGHRALQGGDRTGGAGRRRT